MPGLKTSKTSNIQHEFLAIDEGLGTLLHIDECDASWDWIVPIGRLEPRDMQLVGSNRVLISHHNGYAEFDISTGELVADVSSFEGVTSARRQPDGRTLLAGVNLCETEGVVVVELSQSHEVLRKTVFSGDYVRLIRQTSDGTFLMMCDTRIREGQAGITSGTLRWMASHIPGKLYAYPPATRLSQLDTERSWPSSIQLEKSCAVSAEGTVFRPTATHSSTRCSNFCPVATLCSQIGKGMAPATADLEFNSWSLTPAAPSSGVGANRSGYRRCRVCWCLMGSTRACSMMNAMG